METKNSKENEVSYEVFYKHNK